MNKIIKGDMKQLAANALYWIGDKFSRVAYWKHAERFKLLWTWDAYQWVMHQSVKIQDKYNLSGPWKKFNP